IRGLYFFRIWFETAPVRALGLDVGSKTIGLALMDEAGIAAHPHSVLARVGNSGDVAAVATLVAEHAITDVVVGMPYELSGRVGHRGRQVQTFMKVLAQAIAPVPIHEQDERFTTAEAERVLLDADLSRQKRKSVIDQQAAALILQTWLDAYRKRTESR
ncbi:MAG TPA: Holliday junction resolvase RuvX, partial [Kofleriaceae bacterium]|nr:Holliday junction resolvase RuvX [Kofleriaceae bacterium]